MKNRRKKNNRRKHCLEWALWRNGWTREFGISGRIFFFFLSSSFRWLLQCFRFVLFFFCSVDEDAITQRAEIRPTMQMRFSNFSWFFVRLLHDGACSLTVTRHTNNWQCHVKWTKMQILKLYFASQFAPKHYQNGISWFFQPIFASFVCAFFFTCGKSLRVELLLAETG